MTIAPPAPTRRLAVPARRAQPSLAQPDTFIPKSRLDLVLDGYTGDHLHHARGPVVPCPLCFDPPLRTAR